MMHVTYGTEKEHQRRLKLGLERLGPEFSAQLCYWCDGFTLRNYTWCHVCGAGRVTGLGLLYKASLKPAPESIVNQVLVAANG